MRAGWKRETAPVEGAVELSERLVRWVSARLLGRLTFGACVLWLGTGLPADGGWRVLQNGLGLIGGGLLAWGFIDALRLAWERRRVARLPAGAAVPWSRLPLLSRARRRLGW